MVKIGRNERCPCGSEKKYKKCCLLKKDNAETFNDSEVDLDIDVRRVHDVSRLNKRFKKRWSFEKIKPLSTEEIIQKLQGFGVPFDEEIFLKEVKKFNSAEDLVGSWFEEYPISAHGLDEDFIWMACVVLWERLAPDIMHTERLDDMMQEGYSYLEAKNVKKACDIWGNVWKHLKELIKPGMKDVKDFYTVFKGVQSVFNWCQDFEAELGNAGLRDPNYYHFRIQFCSEFCELLPNTEELILHNMKRAIAESYFGIGDRENGDKTFEKLVETYPENAWGYIGWGDTYDGFPNRKFVDLENAKRIYQMGLEHAVVDKEEIINRLEILESKKASC